MKSNDNLPDGWAAYDGLPNMNVHIAIRVYECVATGDVNWRSVVFARLDLTDLYR